VELHMAKFDRTIFAVLALGLITLCGCQELTLSPAVRTRAFLARTARTCDVIPRARTGLPAIAG